MDPKEIRYTLFPWPFHVMTFDRSDNLRSTSWSRFCFWNFEKSGMSFLQSNEHEYKYDFSMISGIELCFLFIIFSIYHHEPSSNSVNFMDQVSFVRLQLVIGSILKNFPYKILLNTDVLPQNWLGPTLLRYTYVTLYKREGTSKSIKENIQK